MAVVTADGVGQFTAFLPAELNQIETLARLGGSAR
jgi:hypothetical protein